MNLHGSALTQGSPEQDVRDLHRELESIGYAIATAERENAIFGDSTLAAVSDFQKQQGLQVIGVVDEKTATRLNEAYDKTLPPRCRVIGEVATAEGQAVAGGALVAYDQQPGGNRKKLGSATVGNDGRFEISYDRSLVRQVGKHLADLVVLFTSFDGRTTEVGPIHDAPPEATVDLVLHETDSRQVTGRLYTELGTPATDVRLRLYQRGFGGTATQVAETRSDTAGRYVLPYTQRDPANLEIRALNGKAEVPLSATEFSVEPVEVLDLVAPSDIVALPSEYRRLSDDLTVHLNRGNLADAKERPEQRDVTLLAKATGWDARLVALAATAEQLSAIVGIDAEPLYALLRAGVPAESTALARVTPDAVVEALKAGAAGGVVALAEDDIQRTAGAFEAFAAQTRRGAPAVPGSLSTVAELLDATGLSEKDQINLERLVARHGTDPEALWTEARAAGIPETSIPRLKLQGKLGYLTRNSAPLMASLQGDIDASEDLMQALVANDLYRAGSWQERLQTLAGSDIKALDALVPPVYAGTTVQERVDAYAADLAHTVRAASPTAVIARLLETGPLALPKGGEALTSQVTGLLHRADSLGFRFGVTPLSAFLDEHADALYTGLTPEQVAATTQTVTTLTRLYQITPTDEATAALLEAGFTSAWDVTGMDAGAFADQYAEQLGGRDIAELVRARAEQVAAVTLHAFAAGSQLSSTSSMYVMSAPEEQQAIRTELLRRFPTIESMFGDLDFCACESCRSVLSPAAYLTDLLHFLEPADVGWNRFLRDWPDRHGGAPYPFASAQTRDVWQRAHPGAPLPGSAELKPYGRLADRRPDLPHLKLSCENTNVVLPYIDVVNEILEYAVAHGRLEAGAGHDVGSARTEDLLAEPAYVIPEVYNQTLRSAVYPLSLPFDLSLETVRAFLNAFRTPLVRLLDVLCPTEELTPGAGQLYGRAEVARERLGIDPAEYTALTASNPLANWAERYGYSEARAALAELVSPKTLARRLGVSYRELVDVLGSRFVNPGTLKLYDRTRSEGWDSTELRHTDDSPADEFDLVRLNVFVRLWRRLGWSIADVDSALTVFLPRDPALTAATLGPALRSALLCLAHLEELVERAGGSRTEWVSLWAGQPTTGTGPLREELGRRTGTTVRELDLLVQLTGIDPFPALPASAIATAASDILARGTLAFLSVLDVVRSSGLSVDDLDWILRSRRDPRAGGRADEADPTEQLRALTTLESEIRRVETEHGAPADPLLFTDEVLRQKLSLLVSASITETVLRMWSGTVTYSAVRDGVPEADRLDPARLAGEPRLAVRYDAGQQHLTYSGVLLAAEKARLTTTYQSPVLTALLDDVAGQVETFLAAHLLVGEVGGRPTGFLTRADLDLLFVPVPATLTAEERQSALRVKRARLVETVLPEVRRRLTRQAVVGALARAVSAPASLVEPLITDAALVRDPTTATPAPLLEAFAAATDAGVTEVRDGAGGFRLDCYLQVPATGAYRFFVRADRPGVQVQLRLDHLPQPVITGTTAPDGAELVGTSDLSAGKFYRLTLTASALADGQARVLVQGETLPKGPLGSLSCKPVPSVSRVTRAYILLAKIARLVDRLSLDVASLRHVLGHVPLSLPTTPDEPATPWSSFAALADFARLRRDLGTTGETLAGALAAAVTSSLPEAAIRLAPLLRCDAARITAAAGALGLPAAQLSQPARLRTLQELLSLSARIGATPDQITRWARPRPDAAVAQEIRDTLHAKYRPEEWRQLISPISDELRKQRRDALVAFLLHRERLDRVEQLYELFLLDPGMEPIARTSRIRLAISSVQLFIQRCLLNLEPLVRPSAIDAAQWQWRKRYRVWEAGRKIFLWPENWLEPELRDDQSHLFGEMISSLTQGDMSDDLAEDALVGYLAKLEEIARLDIVAMHPEPGVGATSDVLHVLGRTHNVPHRYLYRHRTDGSWTPWEPVTVEPEGDHVTLAVWRGRPHLLWITFLERGASGQAATRRLRDMAEEPPRAILGPTDVQAQLNWAEYTNGQWVGRSASGLNAQPADTSTQPTLQVRVYEPFVPSHTPVWPKRSLVGDVEVLDVNLGWPFFQAFRLVGRNAPVEIGQFTPANDPPYDLGAPIAGNQYPGASGLTAEVADASGVRLNVLVRRPILTQTSDYRITSLPAPVTTVPDRDTGRLLTPFFYADNWHTFLVEPTLGPVLLQDWDGWIPCEAASSIPPGYRPQAQAPRYGVRPDIHPSAQFSIRDTTDWITDPATVLWFDASPVSGKVDRVDFMAAQAAAGRIQ